jgi:hypothetical protein
MENKQPQDEIGKMFSQDELYVLEAVDNESMECTREERDQFVQYQRAYDYACVYADQWGMDVDNFRAILCRLCSWQPEVK